MDTFKGQDNDVLKKVSNDNNCEIVIVPHNLTNKFQPLDLTVNKGAESSISEKYITWFSGEVAKQLRQGTKDKEQKTIITNGFTSAGIMEAIDNAQAITRVENPSKC